MGTKPEVKVKLLRMEDPTFECRSTKTAAARLTNPTTKQFTYTTELYLGAAKAATSGIGSVIIPAGGYVDTLYTIVMPAVEAAYDVFLDVFESGVLLEHYKATEKVTTVVLPAIDIGLIEWV